MQNKGILVLVVIVIAGVFLYEPVMDRFFTDTSLRVEESPSPPPKEEKKIHLGTGGLDLLLSSTGGRILSARCKDLRGEGDPPVELVSGLLKTRGGVRLAIPQLGEDLDDRSYRLDEEETGKRFVQVTPEGLEVRKSYSPLGDYALTFRLTLTNRSKKRMEFPRGYQLIPFYGIGVENEKEGRDVRLVWKEKGSKEVERRKAKTVQEEIKTDKPIDWVALQNRYFTDILIPRDRQYEASFRSLGARQVYAVLSAPPFSLSPGEVHETSFVLYFGPQRKDELRRYAPGLEESIDYGMFAFLGKGVLFLLHGIHGVVANYGVCLILLAVVIRILLFPLTQFNLRSLREMPRILDKIYEIEEADKEDPARVEAQTRPLRKKQVRAMVGSFLPLAIQIPIFLALYQVLNRSIDLRKAPFMFWMTDLSVRDPYFLLPLLMGLVMIFQQRLTAGNPGKDFTWIWMPLGFALLFSFFPAGLVLFWLVDSLFSVMQLLWIASKKEFA